MTTHKQQPTAANAAPYVQSEFHDEVIQASSRLIDDSVASERARQSRDAEFLRDHTNAISNIRGGPPKVELSKLLNISEAEIRMLIATTDLSFEGCRLKHLPPEIGTLVNLTRLCLDGVPGSDNHNCLISLPDTIGNLVNLKTLSVANNRLIALPKSISKLRLLQKLWISNNNLIALPSEIGELAALTVSVAECVFTEIASQMLIVCDNLLESLPSELATLKLSSFVYANNPLTYPPNAHEMDRGALFDYMRLHPQVATSALASELGAAIDAAAAPDLTLMSSDGASGRVYKLNQALAWCRAVAAVDTTPLPKPSQYAPAPEKFTLPIRRPPEQSSSSTASPATSTTANKSPPPTSSVLYNESGEAMTVTLPVSDVLMSRFVL
jgi:hypothetical protein